MAQKLARATLRTNETTLVLPVNPYTAQWGYEENSVSQDTIGGRVVQLLSVQVTDLSVTSVAGSRSELQRVAEGIRSVMDYHIRTSCPANFRVPSRAWDFRVYVAAMPQVGWDVASTAYPYQLNMAIDEDITGVQKKKLEIAALDRLFKGIGYTPEVHGGDPKGFDRIVKTVLEGSKNTSGDTGGKGQEPTRGGAEIPAPGASSNAIQEVFSAVMRQFPRAGSAGIAVCRRISGSSSWSQHAWGNGWDIVAPGGLSESPSSQRFLDMIEKWLIQNTRGGLRLPIAQIIWRGQEQLNGGSVYDHFDHIHVSGDPMFSGTPPCA